MQYRLERSELDDWREREGRTFAWLAKKVGVVPETFYQQLHGSYGPSLATALALEDVTEIPIRRLVRRVDAEKAAACE